MEIYLPRNQELEARKTKLEEKEESCNEQRLRIQEIKDSINNTVENSNVEKEELVKSLNEIQSNQKFVTIVSTTLKEVGTLRSSITEIVNESTQYKAKMMVDIDLANQSYSVAKAQEEELEAKVEEYRNKLIANNNQFYNVSNKHLNCKIIYRNKRRETAPETLCRQCFK